MFKKDIFFKKTFPICMIGIIGTSLANIEKMAFPKGKEISKNKFVSRNPKYEHLSNPE